MTHTYSGYPAGRPRKGEIRPLNEATLTRYHWLENLSIDEYYNHLKKRREYNTLYRANNPERFREYGRAYRLRAKAWKNSEIQIEAKRTKLKITVKHPQARDFAVAL